MKFSTKAFALLLSGLTIFALQAKTLETKTVQVLLSLAPESTEPSFLFFLNAGEGLVTDPSAVEPAGSLVMQTGLVFPARTVDIFNQESFMFDKNGNPLTAQNSIGRFVDQGQDIMEIDLANLPQVGTPLSMDQWGIFFNQTSSGLSRPNQIFLTGSGASGVTGMNQSAINFNMVATGATGANEDFDGTATGRLFVAPDGQSAILEITFSDKIKIKM